MSHYDRDADIAWLQLKDIEPGRSYGEDHGWGLVERDRETGHVVAFEFWEASKRLPAEVLDALPRLEGQAVRVEKTPEGLVVREREPA